MCTTFFLGTTLQLCADILGQSLNVLELPTEVLSHIFDACEDFDLPNLRLVCKQFRDVSTRRFAMVNFGKTIHVVSPFSIDTLVNITEHPVFSEYVRHVAICSARRTQQPATAYDLPAILINHNLCLNAYVKTGRFARRMERVFGNIKSHHGSVTISIYDNPGRDRFGMHNGYTSSFKPMRCCGWTLFSESLPTFVTYRTAETLEETIYAARRARCPVRCLRINHFALRSHSSMMYAELNAAMHRIMESSLTPLDIDCGFERSPQMSFNHVSQHLTFRWFTNGRNIMAWLGVRASYKWLQTQRVTQLSLVNSQDLRALTFRSVLSPKLRHLHIDNADVYSPNFDQNLWSGLIEIISGLSGLRYCRLSNLSYRIKLAMSDEVDHSANFLPSLILPSHGEYVWMSGLPWLKLLFPGGATTVEFDGPDICDRLRDLGYYVRAAEDSKRQQIISDGVVKDGIVCVKRENQEQGRDIGSDELSRTFDQQHNSCQSTETYVLTAAIH